MSHNHHVDANSYLQPAGVGLELMGKVRLNWPVHTYIHTYIHTHIHTYIHTHTNIHTYTHTYIHICIHTSYQLLHFVWPIHHTEIMYRTSNIFLDSAAMKQTSALCVSQPYSSTWMRHAILTIGILHQLHTVKCLTRTVEYGLINRQILVTFNDTVSTVRL